MDDLTRRRLSLAALILRRARREEARRVGEGHQRGRQRRLGCLALLGGLLLAPFLALGAGASFVAAAYTHFSANLPDPAVLGRTVLAQTTRLYERDGQTLLGERATEDRDYVTFAKLPQKFVDATIAVEDRTFWQNPGVDPAAIVRALLSNASTGRQSGASTITQQLVKRLLVGDQVSWDRKIREAILAEQISRRYSKEEIFELYVNQIFYGEQAYGAEAAARRYFSRSLDQLDLGQIALLAGLPQAPSGNDPFVNPAQARSRQRTVLDAMLRDGAITPLERAAALLTPLDLVRYVPPTTSAPWFADRAWEEAARILGSPEALATCGCRITTTLDPTLQALAQQDVTTFVKGLPAAAQAHNAALVAQDPATGEVLAYVGSVNVADDSRKVRGKFDSAGLALRSPGSSWKAITYLSAMETGRLNPASRVWDVSTLFAPGFRPQNAFRDRPFNGPITLRQALRESRNIAAIRSMLAYGGVNGMIDMAHRLGVTHDFGTGFTGASAAIGTTSVTLREVTAAYATIDNLGVRIDQHLVLRITDATGKVIYDAAESLTPHQVVDPRLTYSLIDILKDNANAGPKGSWLTGTYADIGRPAAIKTGTETETRDTYAMGMIPQLTVGVWMGNSDNTPMGTVIHSYTGPLQIWRNFTRHAIAARKWATVDWKRPDGMTRATFCGSNAKYGGYGFDTPINGWCPFDQISEWVIPGFNDPLTREAISGPEFGTFKVDNLGRIVSDSCQYGYEVNAIIAAAELPEWQDDLDTWLAAARAGLMNQSGRFHWNAYRFLHKASPNTPCPAAPPPPPVPSPTPTPTAQPGGGGGGAAPSLTPAPTAGPTPAPTAGPTPAPSGPPAP